MPACVGSRQEARRQALTEKLVVYDIDYPPFMANQAFDKALMSQYPGADTIVALSERLRESGIGMVTADAYLADAAARGDAIVLSNEVTRFTRTLLFEHRLKGAVCTSGESPIVAWRFYTGLAQTSAWYDHLILFPGARRLAGDDAVFHDFFWPYPDLEPAEGLPWEERALLAVVSGNKRAFGWPRPAFDLAHPKPSAGRWYRTWQARDAQKKNPWMQSELYLERLTAIRHFGGSDGFDLYGRGWDQPTSGADRHTQDAINRSYRGEIPPHDKVRVLGGYKFSLCFENTAFPGYITEKIFDCFVAGNIPVYLGAPDIAEYIPREAYIDFREFNSYPELEDHLRGMTREQSQRHLAAAREFWASPKRARFTQSSCVDRLAGLLLSYFE